MLLLALVAFGVPLALSLRDRVDSEVRSQARSQSDVVAATSAGLLTRANRTRLEQLAVTAGATVRGRVLILDRRGRVAADSAGTNDIGTSYTSRPEVAAALRGRSVQQRRHSDTLKTDILATAVPIVENGRPAGAVRITQDVAAVNRSVWRTIGGLALIGAVVLLLGLGAGLVIAATISRPIRRLDDAMRRVAAGHLEVRAPVEGSSEQRSLARSFNEMTDRLARALESQRQFVADASHQLRTPLTGLRLRMEEARASGVSGEAAHEIDEGLHEADRLSAIVDELLVLSRAGEHDAPAEDLELSLAADRALKRWQGLAAERDVSLHRGRDSEPAHAHCARADLDRALDVIVENALKYSPEGSDVELRVESGEIAVLDRGAGLGPGEEEAVFERFHRGRAGRDGVPGTGLGLTIARELARRWGGDATLSRRSGGGTRASIAFPASDDGSQ
ncbi:MAG: ATP-binding protein [Thermoleophilaceae bacterium]